METLDSRLPATFSASMILHAGALGLWLYFSRLPKQEQNRILTNVELLIARPGPAVAARPQAAVPPSAWNFLKMALPSAPRPLEVEAPKAAPKPLSEPVKKLEENKKSIRPSLEALSEKELGRRKALSALEDAGLNPRLAHPKLADAPRLEEVGERKASKSVLAMQELAERRPDARLQPLSALAQESSRPRAPANAPLALPAEAAAPAKASGGLSRLANLLPAESSYPSGKPGGLLKAGPMDAAAPEKRKAEALSERRKATTIEGPLQGRKILRAQVPKFPDWAQAQGVLEASVRIRFTVDAAGKVLEGIQLEQTSGYGELDRLAMDSLRSWQFEPKPEGFGNQWGIITFRFVMQ